MDVLSVLALAMQCVTAAPAPVVAAMAIAETNGSAYSVIASGGRSSPLDFDAAVQAAAIGLVDGRVVNGGIAGVPTTEFEKRKIAYSDGFSACRNMAVAGDFLRESWKRFGGQDEHWRLAALEVATGTPGVEGEFGRKYDAAMTKLREVAEDLPRPSPPIMMEAPSNPAPHSVPTYDNPQIGAWEVYSRDPSRSLFIF